MMTLRSLHGGLYVVTVALLSFAAVTCGPGGNRSAPAGQSTSKTLKSEFIVPAAWEPPRNLLTVDQATFTRAVKRQGWEKGEWYLLLVSFGCGDCNTALKAMDRWADNGNQCIAVGPEAEDIQLTEAYKRQITALGLRYPVKILSNRDYAETGAMIVPTLVVVKDGNWVKAMDVSLGFPPMAKSDDHEK
jgi:hypothetical protein